MPRIVSLIASATEEMAVSDGQLDIHAKTLAVRGRHVAGRMIQAGPAVGMWFGILLVPELGKIEVPDYFEAFSLYPRAAREQTLCGLSG